MARGSTATAEVAGVGGRFDAVAHHRVKKQMRAELDEIAGARNATDARLVDVAARLLADETLFAGPGTETVEAFLAWRCGVTPGVGKRYVDVARRVDELPTVMAAFRDGRLSLDQVIPIVRWVPSWADEQIVGPAAMATPRQIGRLARSYPFHTPDDQADTIGSPTALTPDPDPDPDAGAVGGDPDAAQVNPDVDASTDGANPEEPVTRSTDPADVGWYGVGDDGRWRLVIETDRTAGEIIGAALDESRDRLFRDGAIRPNAVGALTELCQGHLDRVDDPGRRARHHVLVHVEIGTDGSAVASDRLGQPIDDGLRRQVCCDAIVNPLFVDNGLPVSVGRSQRIVPERTRTVVLHRDGGCRVPGCSQTDHLDIHHIVHWENGGPTDTWNLIALCPRHHRLHHRGRLDIVGDADLDTVRFTVDGIDLARDGPSPKPPDDPPPPARWEPPRHEPLSSRWITFIHPSRLVPRPA